MKQGSVPLAERLLSSLSPDAEARQNDSKAVIRLYLQQIRGHEDTIRMRELQIDSLRRELTHSQDKLQSTIHELHNAERRADRLEMRMEMMGMMGAHRDRSSQRHHCKRSRSPSSTGSASAPSPSLSPSQGKHRRYSQSQKGKGRMVYSDEEVDEGAGARGNMKEME